MSPWYVPSLYPILTLCASLAGLVLWRDRRNVPIAAYCAAIAAWTTSILLAASPATRPLGDRTMMVGFFIPATFLHVAAAELGWGPPVVRSVYALGALMFTTGAAVPDLYLTDGGTGPGPLFAPMFLATIGVGLVPLVLLWRDRPRAEERRRYLLLAGAAMALGGALAVTLLLTRTFYPLGLYLLCCSGGLITYVAQATHLPSFGRFIERSQRYALLAATLSTVWMFLLLTIVQAGSSWTWEAALLLFVLTLTAQPLLTEARVWLAGRVFPGRGDADGLARELAYSEARAEHATRLAEIGTMSAAVAHEVRNPLGVIAVCATALERQGASAEVLQEIRDQVERAARFADELLEYGRPAEPQRRPISLADAASMAVSDVLRALQMEPPPAVSVEGEAQVEADPAQISRLVGVLVENAALAGSRAVRVRVVASPPGFDVDDDGPGVPEELAERLLHPFVSGRGRSGPRPGTGLGLAIGAGIAERHGGALRYAGRGELGGARFVVRLGAPVGAG